MKYKLTIAVVIVVLLLALGIVEEIYVRKTFESFGEKLEEILDSPDEIYRLEDVVATHLWWQKRHRYMELFLPHIQLNEIETTYGELIGAVEAEDYDSANALLNRIYATTLALKEMYGFRIGNIL